MRGRRASGRAAGSEATPTISTQDEARPSETSPGVTTDPDAAATDDPVPDWLAAIGRLSPNGFVVDQLNRELASANSWTFSAQSWGIVAAMAVSGMALCTWRLQTGFARR